jgi:hypothetical protein
MWKERFADGSYKSILAQLNVVDDNYLAAYWARLHGDKYLTAAYNPVPLPVAPNVAIRKPTRQSSLYVGDFAKQKIQTIQGGNDGFRGGCGFHTGMDAMPWWEVDLLDSYAISEIHIYNRQTPEIQLLMRAKDIAIETRMAESEAWARLYDLDHESDREFIEKYTGKPLVLNFSPAVTARYVRIISRTPTFLHLAEVEVYGFKVQI